MAMRLKVFRIVARMGFPCRIPLKCSHWSLRLHGGTEILDGGTINGVPIRMYTSGLVQLDPLQGSVVLDVPPVFDANGRPVMWNDTLEFAITSNESINGVVLQYIWDPATPEAPSGKPDPLRLSSR